MTSLKGDGTYHLNAAKSDYYLGGGEPEGYWIGKGASSLGLTGKVDEQSFRHLLVGLHPTSKRRLVRNAAHAKRQMGWDLTWSAPKSVSVLWAVADADTRRQIKLSLHEAVKVALSYLEDVATFTRTGAAGKDQKRARLVAAAFEHGTNRNMEPHLHVHTTVMNVTVDENERTRTLVSWPLYTHQLTAGAIFQKHFAYLLQARLGLLVTKTKVAFEVDGVPEEFMKSQSSRRAEIEEHMRMHAMSSARQAEIATLVTRRPKGKEILARADLYMRWSEAAKKYEFTNEVIRDRILHAATIENDKELLRAVVRLDVIGAARELTDSRSHFEEQDVVRVLAKRNMTLPIPAPDLVQIASEEVKGSRELVRVDSTPFRERFTTNEMLALEEKVLNATKDSRSERTITVSSSSWEQASSKAALSAEQEIAGKYLTASPGRIKLLAGIAGTGKSYLLRQCREAFVLEGVRVVGATRSAEMAKMFERDTGISTRTLASLSRSLENGTVRLDEKTVLVVDEAALIGTRLMAKLVEETRTAEATLILVGDENQLQPIEAGNIFRGMGRVLPDSVSLRGVTRQQEPWAREATKLISAGHISLGLLPYMEKGCVHFCEDREDAIRAIVESWRDNGGLLEPGRHRIIASTKLEARFINRACQEERLKRVLDETGTLPSGLAVDGEIFYPGERIMFLENSRGLRVQNGTTGTVKRIDEKTKCLQVTLSDGDERIIPIENYDKISMAYATNVHKLQGLTCKHTYSLLSDLAVQDRHVTYVQASRHVESASFYITKDLAGEGAEDLARVLSKDRTKTLACELSIREAGRINVMAW